MPLKSARNQIRRALFCGFILLLCSCESASRSANPRLNRRLASVHSASATDLPAPLPPEPVEPVFQPNDRIQVQFISASAAEGKYLLEKGDIINLDFVFEGGEYHILPGDELKVHVGAEPKLDFAITVRPDGRMTIPEHGEIIAAGLTAPELAKAIDEKLIERVREPRTTVSVQSTNTAMIAPLRGAYMIRTDGMIALPYVGEIQAAGQAPRDLAATLSDLASKRFLNSLLFFVTSQLPDAKQSAPKAGLLDSEQIVTVSPDGYIILPELGAIKAAGLGHEALKAELAAQAKQKYANVPQVSLTLLSSESRVVYVQGEVGRAGTFPLSSGLTMLKAISLAGGINDQANLKAVVLVHYKTPVDVVIYRANLKALLTQKEPVKDVLLSAQDVVYVPKSGIAKANLFIDQYITRMLPFSRGVNYTYSEIPSSVNPAVGTSTP